MKKKMSLEDFQEAIEIEGYSKFSDKGFKALFDYLTERERKENVEFDFDVEAVAEGYHEYDGLDEYNQINSTDFVELDQLPEEYIYVDYFTFIIIEQEIR